MTDTILSQILSIRESGIVNMCNVDAVQRVAFDQNMYELVTYIEDDKCRYFHFILHGEEPSND